MKLRLLIFHAVARLLRIQLTYTVKFLPMDRKRTDFRGRAVANPDTVGEALAMFDDIERNPSARKEKTDGLYYLEIEAREGLVNHFHRQPVAAPQPVADDRQGGLLSGLSDTPADGPTATVAAQAAADEAEGAAGLGALGRRDPRAEAITGPDRPLGEVSGNDFSGQMRPVDLTTTLDQLGRR